MAQQGKAGKALAIAAWSSFAGDIVYNLSIVYGTKFIKSKFIF